MSKGKLTRCLAAGLALALLGGCATLPSDQLAERDPLEGFNRGMWKVNSAIDTVALKPATKVYRTVTPRPARRGISRVLLNLAEPFSAINNLLQGKPERAGRNIGRFLINSTIGVAGLADHATSLGIAPADEDFGQTLARWGVDGGPYLVLPFLGPSTLRDGAGTVTYFLTDPYHVAIRQSGLDPTARMSLTGLELIDIRSTLIESGVDAFLATSLDPYAASRSAFLQRRKAQIRDREDNPTDATDTETDEPPIAPEDPLETPALPEAAEKGQ